MWNDLDTGAYSGMIAETISIRGHEGKQIHAYWSRPTGAGAHPGIVLIPQYTFPLLWLSPLFVFLLIQSLLGEPCILEHADGRNWSLVLRFACAALVCGLCWETWNYYAVAKWVYAVPFVHRFQIWEMPLIGFAGYLPFGVECAAVTAWICPDLIEAGPLKREDAGQ